MKKQYFLVVFLVLVVIGALAGGWTVQKQREDEFRQLKQEVAGESLQTSNNTKVEYNCERGSTAFEILNQKYDIEAEDSSLGKFVTSIEGTKQGNGKYWLYSIDQKEATISASAYVCQGNEKVTWELK